MNCKSTITVNILDAQKSPSSDPEVTIEQQLESAVESRCNRGSSGNTPTGAPEPGGEPGPGGEPEPTSEPAPGGEPGPNGEPAPGGEPGPSSEPEPGATQATGTPLNHGMDCVDVVIGSVKGDFAVEDI